MVKKPFQTLNFACFTSETGKITVLLKELVILLVSEVKQTKSKFEFFGFQCPRRGLDLDLPETNNLLICNIKHAKTLVRT
jgi:hypothetical protein